MLRISAKRLQVRGVRGSKSRLETRNLSVGLTLMNNNFKNADPTEETQTVQYINTVTKPYTVTTYARPNIVMTQGKGSYLYDLENRKYVDFVAGIAVTALGHSNPEVADIISKQSKILMHCSNLYYNFYAGELAHKLVDRTKNSGGMKDAQRVFLSNSGSEANEAALKFARKYAKSINDGKVEFIAFDNAFHGRTMGALSVTANEKYKKPFLPMVDDVKLATYNDIESVEKIISKEKTCAVIIEPIQGEGGITKANEDFLIQLKKLCEEHDVLLIYDEIQCGLGRTGKLWAHSHLPEEAHPDILTMAKALGNGFPIGAVVITEKVEDCLKVGDHGTTYGGNPLGSRIGSYVVDQVSDPEFLEAVNKKSKKFLNGLNKLKEKYPQLISDVRGQGLLLGIQFCPNIDVGEVVNISRECGLLVLSAGLNVLRLVPALNIPDEVIEEGMNILDTAIGEIGKRGPSI